MREIAGHEVLCSAGKSHLEERLIAPIRQMFRKRNRGHSVAAKLDKVEEGGHRVFAKPEFGSPQDFAVFGQDSSIKTEGELS